MANFIVKQGPVQVASAWAVKQRLTLCQDPVPKKKNEVRAIEKRLDQLDPEGRAVTIDAKGALADRKRMPLAT